MGERKEKEEKKGRRERREGRKEGKGGTEHYNTCREKENLTHFQKLGIWSINTGVLNNDSTFLKSKSYRDHQYDRRF